MNKKNQSVLLELARKTITCKLQEKEIIVKDIPSELKDLGSCFVTLTLKGNLRGCIGHLEAFEPLYKNVMNNAVNAALYDNRFSPLTKEELEHIKIEISVLKKPEKLHYVNKEDLLEQLTTNLGVILKKDFKQATFLPQVWQMFSTKEEFLESLSLKAGLHKDAWQDNPEIYVYEVQKFSEFSE